MLEEMEDYAKARSSGRVILPLAIKRKEVDEAGPEILKRKTILDVPIPHGPTNHGFTRAVRRVGLTVDKAFGAVNGMIVPLASAVQI